MWNNKKHFKYIHKVLFVKHKCFFVVYPAVATSAWSE